MKSTLLILCTGNSCRSQMAEGFLRSFDNGLVVYSAGTRPEKAVSPFAVKVMKEAGIDISSYSPNSVNEYTDQDFDYVITVCENAKEICPVFSGKVKHHLHLGFEDPANAKGTEEEILTVYRKTRDQIKDGFSRFYQEKLNQGQ